MSDYLIDEFTLDENQKLALKYDALVAVSAGAGSGKTRMLASRYFDILSKGLADIENIVAITFTEKAAAELKDRIRRIINQSIQRGKESKFINKDTLIRLSSAPIGTIHSFCTQILRTFPVEAKIDPEFIVLEEVESSLFLEDVIRNALLELHDRIEHKKDNELTIEERTFLDLLQYEGYNIYEIMEKIRKIIEQARQKNLLLNEWKTPSLKDIVERVSKLKEPSAILLDLVFGYKENWKLFWREQEKMFARYIEELDQVIDESRKSEFNLLNVAANAEKLCSAMLKAKSESDLVLIQDYPLSFKGTNVSRNIVLKIKERLMDDVIYLRNYLNRLLGLADGLENIETEKKITELYLTLTKYVYKHFDELKRRSNMLDFSDLLEKTYSLLKENEFIRKYLQKRYKFIMIDEFQDTDVLQYRILKCLIDGTSNNFCIVGDPKQSIYGFRGADVTVFPKAIMELNMDKIYLSKNYRSQQGLVAFYNDFFGKLLQPEIDELFEVEYDAMTAVRKNIGKNHVEFMIDFTSKLDRRIEAENIAKRILKLIKDEKREFGDIALLFRSFTYVPIYTAVFRKYKIPYHIFSGGGFYSSQEIMDVTNYIRYLLYPHDKIALLSILRSPFCGVSDDALVAYFKKLDVSDPKLNAEIEKINKFKKTAHKYRKLLGKIPISQLLKRIVNETGYSIAVAGIPDGIQKLANIDKLIMKIQNLESTQLLTPSTFIEFVQLMSIKEARETPAQVELEDRHTVKIMTIHAAKGLEFPVVIIPDIQNKGFGASQDVIVDNDFGIIVKMSSFENGEDIVTPVFSAMMDWQNYKERMELYRLLYVASTRAKDKLIYSGICKINERKSGTVTPYLPDNSFLEILLYVLEYDKVRKFRQKIQLEAEVQAVMAEFYYNPRELIEDRLVTEKSDESIDELIERLQLQMPLIKPSAVTTRISKSTKIVDPEQREAARIGIILHRFFELWNFEEKNIKSTIKALKKEYPRFTDTVEEIIERTANKFLQSDSLKLVKSAMSLRKEYSFITKVIFPKKPTIIAGKIDLVLEFPQKIILIDYKYYPVLPIPSDHLKKYEKQLYLYAKALETTFHGKEIQKFLLILPNCILQPI